MVTHRGALGWFYISLVFSVLLPCVIYGFFWSVQPDFFSCMWRIFLFGVRGWKTFLVLRMTCGARGLRVCGCMRGGGVCEMSVLYNNVSRWVMVTWLVWWVKGLVYRCLCLNLWCIVGQGWGVDRGWGRGGIKGFVELIRYACGCDSCRFEK